MFGIVVFSPLFLYWVENCVMVFNSQCVGGLDVGLAREKVLTYKKARQSWYE